jgi:hypothetical protein
VQEDHLTFTDQAPACQESGHRAYVVETLRRTRTHRAARSLTRNHRIRYHTPVDKLT